MALLFVANTCFFFFFWSRPMWLNRMVFWALHSQSRGPGFSSHPTRRRVQPRTSLQRAHLWNQA